MPSNLKRRLAIGVIAMAAAAFAGGAYAATRDSAANARQAFLNDVAKRLHVTPKQLSAALQGAAIDQLNAAVASGRLTQARANALKQRITKGGTVPLPAGPGFGGAGPRLFAPPGRFGGPPGSPGPRFLAPPGAPGAIGPRGGMLSAAASYLGISERQLLSQLSGSKSLAQIAKARGKSTAGLKDAMTASIKAALDKAVAAKMITSAQEQRILNRISSKLGDAIDQAGTGLGFRPVPGFGFRPAPGLRFRAVPGLGFRTGPGPGSPAVPRFGFRGPGKGMLWPPATSPGPSGPAAAPVAPQAGPAD